jgi:ribonuclease E
VFATSGKRRKALSVAAIGLSTLLLVSCGGDDEDNSTPTVAPATQAVEETEEATVEPTVEEEVVATPELAASPAAATPVAPGIASPVAPDVASPVAPATPMEEVVPAVPAIDLEASPVASPIASPVASPVASPAS